MTPYERKLLGLYLEHCFLWPKNVDCFLVTCPTIIKLLMLYHGGPSIKPAFLGASVLACCQVGEQNFYFFKKKFMQKIHFWHLCTHTDIKQIYYEKSLFNIVFKLEKKNRVCT